MCCQSLWDEALPIQKEFGRLMVDEVDIVGLIVEQHLGQVRWIDEGA